MRVGGCIMYGRGVGLAASRVSAFGDELHGPGVGHL